MFNKILGREKDTPRRDVIVVSGLPRSGTSMMMKMLAEGGLPAVTDSLRSADHDNPNGYFEFEIVKKMPEGKFDWLQDTQGRVVKIISALLEYLPNNYHYKVIFMERSLAEVLASQKKMLEHRAEDSSIDDAEMQKKFTEHLAAIKYWLARQPNMEVLYVDYGRMLRSPSADVEKIVKFLDMSLDPQKMLGIPNESLYRNRA